MEIKLYFQMLKRGWWIIVSTALAAISISLALSYTTTPQFQASSRLIIMPNSSLFSSSDVVRSLDTLDRTSTVTTYAEVLGSERIFEETLISLQINPEDLLDYSRSAVVLPNSSVLELTVNGPNPDVTAKLANEISRHTINYTEEMNQIYTVDFLDTAIAPSQPITPQPLRDASLALILGLVVGALLAIFRDQIQAPFEALRTRSHIDAASSAFNRRYLLRDLEETQARSQGNIGLGLIHLEGLGGIIEMMPSSVTLNLMQQITNKLRKELRGNDRIGRWSEIQYAVVLPSTPVQAAEHTLDRIRQALSEPVKLDQVNTPFYLEPYVGVAVSSTQESVQSLIERAENELNSARQKHLAASNK